MTQDRCNVVEFGVFLALWNACQNLKTPTIHFQMATWLQKCWEHGQKRVLLQAFRASGKSTLVGIFIAWLLCNNPDLRILVLSAESQLAEKMVRTIRKVIETHPLTSPIRPDRPDQWASDSFTVQRNRVSRDPSVLARGLYANITGARADVIVCDDVEVPNTCDTGEKREKLRDRLSENDFILTPGGTQIYIGTPHTYFTIYAPRPRGEIGETDIFLKEFRRLKIPILDAAGKSTWPERYAPDEIERMRRAAGPLRFASQMMLQPANAAQGRLDATLLKRYDEELEVREAQKVLQLSLMEKKLMSASAWWDPSFGGHKSDGSVVAVAYTDEAGDYWLHRVHYIRVQAGDGEDEATLQCREVCELAQACFLPSITIETNGIGKFLPAILRREMDKARIPCTVLEASSKKSKDTRILEAFDTVLAARALHVHGSVYNTRFVHEMAEWRPGLSGAADDGLDAAAGALSLEPVRLRRDYFTGGKVWSAHGQPQAATTDFEV